MTPAVLTWALAQATGSAARGLADAYTSGALRVTFEGRTVEYRTLADIDTALSALYNASFSEAARPASYTLASFRRSGT